MGTIQPPPRALRLIAISSRYPEALTWARERIEGELGPHSLVSDPFVYDDTDYYEREMGAGLFKQFVASDGVVDPGELAGLKHLTNGWEEEYIALARHPEPRPLNLDPGYISESKLVLASTKNHWHRVYLSQGIFAEVTLVWSRREGWKAQEWTYPDYRRGDYQAFFVRCREWLRGQSAG